VRENVARISVNESGKCESIIFRSDVYDLSVLLSCDAALLDISRQKSGLVVKGRYAQKE
jgi:hypothetical protein